MTRTNEKQCWGIFQEALRTPGSILYQYKKELMSEGIITPIANNLDTQKIIINFTALKSFDFSDTIIFPFKSTWITPRFDS